MPQICCKLWTLPACCKLSTGCNKSVEIIKLQQVCENQTCCNLIFADLYLLSLWKHHVNLRDLRGVSTSLTSILYSPCNRTRNLFADLLQVGWKLLKNSLRINFFGNQLHQACYHQAGETMRTHPDIGLMTARQQAYRPFWLCIWLVSQA